MMFHCLGLLRDPGCHGQQDHGRKLFRGGLEEAEEKYERSYELKSKGYDLEVIEKRVCALLGIEKGELNSDSRRQAIAEARGLFCYWAVRELGYSLAEIGQALGRSGPGVGYAVQRGERLANQQKYKLIE